MTRRLLFFQADGRPVVESLAAAFSQVQVAVHVTRPRRNERGV